jgi:hypothetical protein
VISPTAAYGRDVDANGEPFTSADGEWLLVATLVAQAAVCASSERRRILRRADEHARASYVDRDLHRLGRREFGARLRRGDALLLLAASVEEAGAFHLAHALVDGLLECGDALTPLQHGRLLARRGRLSYKLDDRELAEAQFIYLDALGRKSRVMELRARAALGLVTIAQLSGNLPALLDFARQAVRFSRKAGIPTLEARSQYALMIGAQDHGLLREALNSAWRMYELAAGDRGEEIRSLVALGQLLLRLSQPAAALSAFTQAVMERAPSVVLLPALSGIASAAARLGPEFRSMVTWAIREVDRFDAARAPTYAYAASVLECSETLRVVGDEMNAERLRRRGLHVAESAKLNQLVHEALSAPAERPSQGTLTRDSRAIVNHFAAARTFDLPARVTPADDVLASRR